MKMYWEKTAALSRLGLVALAGLTLFVSGAVFAEEETEHESMFFFATSDTHIGNYNEEHEIYCCYVGTKNTIDIMNDMPGKAFPFGGEVNEPEGLIIAGDLHEADDNMEENWEDFAELFAPEGNAMFDYPVFEGIGNHDFANDYIELIGERNERRPVDLHTCEQNYHYTWEWSGVQMIQLHAFPGKGGPIHEEDNNRDRPWNDPEDSLIFLEQVLEEKVMEDQPIVVTFHYGFDGWGKGWWSNKERDWFEEAIEGYNVVLIIHGHSHSYKTYTWRGYDILETGDTHTPEGGPGQFTVFRINRENDNLEWGQYRDDSWVDEGSIPLTE